VNKGIQFMKKTTHQLAILILVACAALPFASFAQDAQSPKGMVNIRALQAASDPVKGKKAQTVVPLTIAIPSVAFSATESSLYRAGYERELLDKACGRILAAKCVIKVVDEDPRTTPLMTLSGGPSGIDAFVWGGEVRMNDKATNAALFDALESMATSDELTKIKRKFMKMDRVWPKPLLVGTDSDTMAQAKSLCAKIHAKCTFVSSKDFKALAKRFDASELQWVAHSQSWLFETKDLEDRLTTAMEDLEKKQ
jgi:hypothetical protein